MIRKLTSVLAAAALATSLSAASVSPAQAGNGSGVGLGIAAGIIGLGILGAATAHAHPHYGTRYYADYDDRRCYRGPRECHWSGRRCFENRYGDEVCRGGRYVCSRPLICD